jgi:hypothetical protein
MLNFVPLLYVNCHTKVTLMKYMLTLLTDMKGPPLRFFDMTGQDFFFRNKNFI